MPTDKCLGTDDRDQIQDRWRRSIELDEEQAIIVGEPDPPTDLTPQHSQLLSKRAFSASRRLFDLNGEANMARVKNSSAIIA